MTLRIALVSAFVLGASSLALAAAGTPEQQAACRPDVRKLCHGLKMAEGDDAFLQCLQAHREALSKPCLAVLESLGK